MFVSLSSTTRICSPAIGSSPRGQRERERAPLAELAVDPDPAAVQLDEPLREREAEPGALALRGPGVGLLELLEDPLVIFGGDPGAGVGHRDPHLAVDLRALTSTAPPAGVNFTAFESRLKITCRIRRSSPPTTSTLRVAASATWTPSFVARSRTITTPRSSASSSENGATSSSICPASTFDRSRMSLIRASRWLPEARMSSRYSSCFALTSPNTSRAAPARSR